MYFFSPKIILLLVVDFDDMLYLKKSQFLFPFYISDDQDVNSTNYTISSVSNLSDSYLYQGNILPKIVALYHEVLATALGHSPATSSKQVKPFQLQTSFPEKNDSDSKVFQLEKTGSCKLAIDTGGTTRQEFCGQCVCKRGGPIRNC